MKKYYLFLIILLALKCSIIAQKVEPSRTYTLIEKCYCTSFKQGEKLYNGTIVYVCTKCGKETMANPNGVGGTIEDIIEQNKREAKLAELMKNPSQASNAEAAKMLGTIVPSTITKQQEEAMGDLINQSVKNQEEIIKHYEEKHYCLSFNFVKESGVITKFLIYECTECGQQVQILPPDTIENKIADNKRKMEFEKAAINALKKNQSIPNQQKPITTSKPQSKPTSKPSTPTKKQPTNLDIPSVNRSSSEVDVKQPKPTVEENLCKVSDGLDAFIDMVKKISNKDGTNNTTLKENYNPIQERALKEALRYNNKSNPNYDPNKELSVSKADLREFAERIKEEFPFEYDSHFGRNIAALLPFSLDEMIYELKIGNPNGFYIYLWDQYHQDNEENTFGIDTVKEGHWEKIEDPYDQLLQLHKMKEEGIKNVKFVNTQGDEVVYNLQTGKIDKSKKMGTSNKGETGAYSATFGNHQKKDIYPHKTKAIEGNQFTRDGDQYKYVGILYERDKKYPDRYYIINGQTGERMTAKQAYEFPTTVSDMYVDDSPYQSVIDPLDPQYEEHLNYHKNQKKVFGK